MSHLVWATIRPFVHPRHTVPNKSGSPVQQILLLGQRKVNLVLSSVQAQATAVLARNPYGLTKLSPPLPNR